MPYINKVSTKRPSASDHVQRAKTANRRQRASAVWNNFSRDNDERADMMVNQKIYNTKLRTGPEHMTLARQVADEIFTGKNEVKRPLERGFLRRNIKGKKKTHIANL